MQRRHPQHIPMSLNHPQYQLMQNIVLTQQLQKERAEFEQKNKQLDQKLEQQLIYDKIQQTINQNNDALSKRLEEKIAQLQMQNVPQSGRPKNQSMNDYEQQQLLKKFQDQLMVTAAPPPCAACRAHPNPGPGAMILRPRVFFRKPASAW